MLNLFSSEELLYYGAEQTKLRNEYRALVIGNLSSQLGSIKIKNPDGSITDVKKKN